jgi:hypothetical protein
MRLHGVDHFLNEYLFAETMRLPLLLQPVRWGLKLGAVFLREKEPGEQPMSPGILSDSLPRLPPWIGELTCYSLQAH